MAWLSDPSLWEMAVKENGNKSPLPATLYSYLFLCKGSGQWVQKTIMLILAAFYADFAWVKMITQGERQWGVRINICILSTHMEYMRQIENPMKPFLLSFSEQNCSLREGSQIRFLTEWFCGVTGVISAYHKPMYTKSKCMFSRVLWLHMQTKQKEFSRCKKSTVTGCKLLKALLKSSLSKHPHDKVSNSHVSHTGQKVSWDGGE